MMNQFDVNIRVPPQEAKSDIICISGVPTNVEAAKEGLAEKVVELEKEKEEKALKSFEIQVDVNPEYHPKIIGRSGAVITNLRQVHDVNIQLPKKEAENANIITISGKLTALLQYQVLYIMSQVTRKMSTRPVARS